MTEPQLMRCKRVPIGSSTVPAIFGRWGLASLGAMMWLVIVSASARAQWTYFDNNAEVRALHESGDVLWVGTNGGMLLIDLPEYQITSKITAGRFLADNSVRVIAERDGAVLVGTDNGLSTIRGDQVAVRQELRGRRLADVRSLSFGPNQTTYVGTFGRGVGVIGETETAWITRADSLLDNKVYAVSVLDTARIYYATSLGLCAFRDSVWVGFQAGAGLPRGEVVAMRHHRGENCYLQIEGRGLYRFNGKRGTRIGTSEAFEGEVAAIDLSTEGDLWAVGRRGGIAKYRHGVWTVFGQNDNEIAGARWRTVHIGRSGTVYAGSADGLVAVILEDRVHKIPVPSALPSGYVGPMAQSTDGVTHLANGPFLAAMDPGTDRLALAMDVGSVFAMVAHPDGSVWASTPWGLLRHDGDKWRELKPDIEPLVPVFLSLAIDPGGRLWAGGHGGEVYRYDGELWVEYAATRQLAGGPVSGLSLDADRQVWALAGSEAVHRYDGVRWGAFDLSHFGSEALRFLTTSTKGRPIAVTDNHIWKYETDSGWSAYEFAPTETSRGHYRRVAFDGTGGMVVGTTEGIILVRGGESRWIAPREGLRGREVTGLMVEREGNLWVGFRGDGISRASLGKLW